MSLYKKLLIIFLIVIILLYIKKSYENFYGMDNNLNLFKLTDYKLLFFDIFYKNNKLYLILPVYSQDVRFIDNIIITYNRSPLKLSKKIYKIEVEPTLILIYDLPSNNNYIYITVNYKNLIKTYYLNHINNNNKKTLALTTLFKHDYKLFDTFYNYYSSQGVEHFFMYYNGKIDNEVRKTLNKKNVNLIEWDFRYWHDPSCEYKHHAQLGQMHHAIYRYGKDNFNYMIFCNLDEYMLSPHRKLSSMIYTNYDTYGFCNLYSETDQEFKDLPSNIMVSEKLKFKNKSKCIHKLDSIDTININYGGKYNKTNPSLYTKNNYLFHFYKFNSNKSINCNKKFDLGFLKKHLLFIHVPKTGGTMVEETFLKYGYFVGIFLDKNARSYINNYKCRTWHFPQKHSKINFNDYITFIVVREPISRLLSELNWKHFGYFYKNRFSDINRFVSYHFSKNEISYDGDCHLVPQYEYLYDSYGNKVENILNQKTLNKDLEGFIKKYNLDILVSNKKVNTTTKKYFIEDISYNNLELIKNYYKKDLELFS